MENNIISSIEIEDKHLTEKISIAKLMRLSNKIKYVDKIPFWTPFIKFKKYYDINGRSYINY